MAMRGKPSTKVTKTVAKKSGTASTTKSKTQSQPEIHSFLKEKRVQAQLSQADVAKELGYSSPQFISNWERGLVLPPLQTMSTLVKLYKLNREDVIERLVAHSRHEIESHLKSKR